MRRPLFLIFALVLVGLLVFVNLRAEPPAKPTPGPAEQQKPINALVTQTYSVADLVVPIATNSTVGLEPAKRDAPTSQAQPLVELLVATIAPSTWTTAGGSGVIRYSELEKTLVVSQAKSVHEEIQALLSALRRLQDVQVVMDIQVISVADATWERTGQLDGLNPRKHSKNDDNHLTALNDAQVKQLISTLRKDPKTEVLQSPKLTTFNGQTATIQSLEELFFLTGVKIAKVGGGETFVPQNEKFDIGFKTTVCSVVSADRRTILVDLKSKRTLLESPTIPLVPLQIPIPHLFEGDEKGAAKKAEPVIFQLFLQQPKISTQIVDQKFRVDDGGTMVIVAGKEFRENPKCDCPLAAMIPCGVSLFGATGGAREVRSTIYLVTPRIVVNSEIEAEILGLPAPAVQRGEPGEGRVAREILTPRWLRPSTSPLQEGILTSRTK